MLRLAFIFFVLCVVPLLAAETKVLAFAGSTRKDSFNKQLVQQAASIAREMGANVTVIDLKDYSMPFYDGDVEAEKGLPENAKRLRKLLMENNAIIIATPEYNASMSGVLKNALDWASRNEKGQYSQEAFKGKTFAIMSASPGGGGGKRGLVQLRAVIEAVGGKVISQEVSIPRAHEYFEKKEINPALKKEVEQLLSVSRSSNG